MGIQQFIDDAAKQFDRALEEMDKALDTLTGKSAEDRRRAIKEDQRRVLQELLDTTTDPDELAVTLRALRIYRRIVQQAQAEGTVRFYESDGETYQTLKVRLRK